MTILFIPLIMGRDGGKRRKEGNEVE